MNPRVRTYLIEVARKNNGISYYNEMLHACGIRLDLNSDVGFQELKKILREIGIFEKKYNRPMLTSMVIGKKENIHGYGFFELAEEFGKGNANQLKKEFWGFSEAERCRKFWQQDENYKKYASPSKDVPEEGGVDFFKQEELDFFKLWQYKAYIPNDPEHIIAGNRLSETVWEKSICLGKEIIKHLQGFELDGERRWTQRGWRINERGENVQAAIVKPYTWVKVFRNTDKGKDIFFTFGLDAYPDVEAFVYKIDCQDKRDSELTQQQISLCKSLIPATAKWNEIAFEDLTKSNWSSLIATCVQFVNDHTAHYDAIIQAVWGEPIPPTLFKNKLIKKEKPKDGYDSIPPTKIDFKGLDVDFQVKAKEQKDLGDKGEALVKQREIEFLQGKNLHDKSLLVDIVQDGKGYDVFSFDEFGNEKYIEVKTTTGNEYSPLFLSDNEVEFMRLNQGRYCIYRVYNYDEENNFGEFYELSGDIESQLLMKPTQYKVLIKKEV